MDYQGQPCKICGQTITVYSLSGLCRNCWHRRRGNLSHNQSEEQRITDTLKYHTTDLLHYHSIRVGGITMPEHRYIYEKSTRKKIPKGWVIHHLNGLKGDNRPENLVAMPKGDHDTKTLVNTLKNRIRELEQELLDGETQLG